MMVDRLQCDKLERDGYSILPAVFSARDVELLVETVSAINADRSVRSRGGVYAIRNLLAVSPAINELAHSAKLRSLVEPHLSQNAFPVRGILFDKTTAANWLVPWHQDLTICVDARREVEGYGPWTTKAGVVHVQPPAKILENMLSVRIHLDPCGEANGALRVIPGTHRMNRFTAEQIAAQQTSHAAATCTAQAGDVLLMRPLLLHASSSASQALHRRVIHIDYASTPLDGGLAWRPS